MSPDYFKPEEVVGLAPKLVEKMDTMRALATVYAQDDGYPGALAVMIITSGVRRNDDDSEHQTGEGVDIACGTSRKRHYLLRAAYAVGFRRIGIYDRHIHLGISIEKDQDVSWTGKSK